MKAIKKCLEVFLFRAGVQLDIFFKREVKNSKSPNPFPLSELYLNLLKKGIIDLRGGTYEHMFGYVRECIMHLMAMGSPDVTIYITSSGGSVENGLDIHDLLRTYPGKKVGKVYGMARSMAIVILQACDERICAENARILVHHIARREISLDVLRSPEKIQAMRDEMEAMQARLDQILSQRTKMTQEEMRLLAEKNQDISAQQALEFGFIDSLF